MVKSMTKIPASVSESRQQRLIYVADSLVLPDGDKHVISEMRGVSAEHNESVRMAATLRESA
jgi:hypothetical protein